MQAAEGTPEAGSDAGDAHPQGRTKALVLFVAIASTFLAIDAISKIVAVDQLTGRGRVPVIGDILGLTLIYNPGAAFGTGTEFTVALSLAALTAALAVLWYARRLASTTWAVALGFLMAGITGNLMDRIFRAPGPLRGKVVDFLQLPNWPVFNVADICINIGAGLILVQAFRGIGLDGTREPESDDAT